MPHSRRRHAPEAAPDPLPAKSRSRWRSPVLITTLALLVVVVLAAAWVGTRAWSAKGELEQAQSMLGSVKEQVSAGEYEGLSDAFAQIQAHTVKARQLTDGPLWSASEHVPLLGSNLRVLRELTAVVDDAMTAAEPLADLAGQLTPEALTPQDGAIPLAPFETAATAVPAAAADFATLQTRLADVTTTGTVHQLADAKTTLVDVVDTAASALDQATPLVEQLPTLLGADGTRTYVVMFLNNAELRALGGTALSFAEITVDHGKIELQRTVPTSGGTFQTHDQPVIPLPDEVAALYPGTLGHFIANATIRPDAITAAQIVTAEWKGTFGQDIDGVISMDAGALSLLLKAVGPVTIPTGDVVTGDNVEKLLLNEVYQRYNTGDGAKDNEDQNAVYAETVSATFGKLTSGSFDPVALLESMSTAAEEHRMSVWFPDTTMQTAIADTPFAATGIPESTDTEDVVGVFLKNASWSKLDYYLKPTVTTASAVCTADGREVHRVTLDLENTLAPGKAPDISPSVAGGYDLLGLTKGEQQYVVYFYLPKGATLLSTSVDGEAQDVLVSDDTGHAVKTAWVKVMPGATGEVTADFLMGSPGDKPLRADVTPTIKKLTSSTTPLDCSTVVLP